MPGPRILLVEDNRLLRWWMSSSLERSGFVVFAPENVSDALAAATSLRIDLLVTDWHLGGSVDGFEILAQAKRWSPSLFSILISAEADDDLALRARQTGFDVVIQKPFPVAEIVGAARGFAEKAKTCSPEGEPEAVCAHSSKTEVP